MTKKLILLLTGLVLFVTSACSFGTDLARSIQITDGSGQPLKTLQGSGNIVKEDRPVNDFDQVVLNGIGKLVITQGDSESLVIEADDNILPIITAEVKNRVLTIGFDEKIRLVTKADITYTLKLKDLKGLEISGLGEATLPSLRSDALSLGMSGSGKIQIDDLQATTLTVNSSGLGAFDAAGQVDSISLNFSGAGFFNAENLKANSATLTINGTGTATVWVADQLDVNISGGGYVKYYGNPQVTKNVSGLGKIEKAGDK